MTPDFADKPVLTGELVTLVPVARADVGALWPLYDDPEVARLTGSVHRTADTEPGAPLPYSYAELEGIYQRWSTATDRIVWTVRDNADGRVIGESVLNDLDPDNLSCGFRIWIVGPYGRGLGTEATRLSVDHALSTVGLHRVSLEVYAFNPRARRAYEKVGFRHEGTLRHALRYDDAWIDAEVMALLADEWPPQG